MKRLYRINCDDYITSRDRTAATDGLFTSLDDAIAAAKTLAAQHFGPGVGCKCWGGVITEDSGVKCEVGYSMRWPFWTVSRHVTITYTQETTKDQIETITVDGVEYSRTVKIPTIHTNTMDESFAARIHPDGYLNEPGDNLTRSDESIDEELGAADDALAEAFKNVRGVIAGEGGDR